MNFFLVSGLINTIVKFDDGRPVQITFGHADLNSGLSIDDIKKSVAKDLIHCGWQEVDIGVTFHNGTSYIAYVSTSNFEPEELSNKEKRLCEAIDTLEAEILKRDQAIKQIMKKLLIQQ